MINKMISSVGVGATSAGGTGTLYIDKTDDNYGIGENLTFNALAANNIAIGSEALNSTSGDADFNVGIGSLALTDLLTGDDNVAIGYLAATNLTSGSSNVAIGSNVLTTATTAADNMAFGNAAMSSVPAGVALEGCVAIGTSALTGLSATTGANYTIAIGQDALKTLTSGTGNLGIGYSAGKLITTGARNVAIGYLAMDAMVDGDNNIAIGNEAMGNLNDTDANSNICIGSYAGDGMGTVGGADNIFIGKDTGGGTWTGSVSNYNIGIGNGVMDAIMNGALDNIGVGNISLGALTTGDSNTAFGSNTLRNLETGDNNTAIGFQAGNVITTGTNNTLLGYDADVDVNSDSYQVRIGHYGALRYMTAQITMDDFTTVADNDAANAPLLKIPRYGFLKRVTCTVVTANGGGTGEYNISLGTAVEAAGDTVAGRIELIGADDTDNSDFTGATYKSSTFSADGDTQLNIETAKYLHIWEADQATDDSSGWTLMEAQARYLYVCHANASNATDGTNAVLRITAEYFGED